MATSDAAATPSFPGEGLLPRTTGWAIAVVATLTMAVSYIDRQVLAAVAPSIQSALHLSNAEYGWLQSGFSLAYLVGAPLAGTVLDRIGARRGLLVSVLLWSTVAAAHALAPTFGALLALRIALGATEAPSFPGAAQAVRRALAPRDRSAGFGFLFTGGSLGSIIAAPLALKLDARFGWKVAFVGSALVGLAWVPLWLFVTRKRSVREALAPGARDAPSASPSRLQVLSDPAVVRAIVLVLACVPTVMFVLLWYPKYLVAAFALSKAELARYLWMPPFFFDVGAVSFGALASLREGRSPLVGREPLAGSPPPVRMHGDLVLLGGLAMAAFAAVPYAQGPLGAILLGSVAMFGGGALHGRLTADMLARISPAHASLAAGFPAAAQSLVHIVANPIVGQIIDAHGLAGYHRVLVACGLVALPGALAWVAWPMRDRPGQDGVASRAAAGTAGSSEP